MVFQCAESLVLLNWSRLSATSTLHVLHMPVYHLMQDRPLADCFQSGPAPKGSPRYAY